MREISDYESFIQSVTLPQDKKYFTEGFIINFFCWLISFVVWGLLTAIIYYSVNDGDSILIKKLIISYIFYYIAYFIIELMSPTAKYLKKLSFDDIKYFPQEIENIFNNNITFKFLSYNNFEYKSCRDISGVLELKCGKREMMRKAYILLELELEVNFADAVSVYDYESDKQKIFSSNIKNSYSNAHELIYLNNFKFHYILNINKKKPCSINYYLYVFFVFLMFGQFYKIYFNTFCIFKKFKIRKIISTRNDLSNVEFGQSYEMLNPQIIFNDKKYSYSTSKNFIYNGANSKGLPSQDIVRQAKKFENRIPKYNIYSQNNKYKANIKQDNDKISVSSKGKEFVSGVINERIDSNEIVTNKVSEEDDDDLNNNLEEN